MIHFVYAGSPDNNSNASPYTITRELYKYLKARIDVRYYDWCTEGCPDVNKNDIILGHPNYSKSTITRQFFTKAKCRAKCLIFPLHTSIPEYCYPFNDLVQQADELFSITGSYWYDNIDTTIFATWKPIITRLDMAIDPTMFPYTRTSFAPPGCRNLLYIGSPRPEKNIEMLYEVKKQLPSLQLTWYGGGFDLIKSLPKTHVYGWTDFTPAISAEMNRHSDIFINCSRSDANPTTLLEATAWGLIPICTITSGYQNNPMFTNIPLDDVAGTVNIIHQLQGTSETELLERTRANRAIIETDHTWDKFGATIWKVLQKYM